MRRLRFVCLAGVVLAAAFLLAGAAQADLRAWLLSYEAVPITAPTGADKAPYAEKQALAHEALRTIVPEALKAAGLDPAAARTQIAPGGYAGKTNPALHTQLRAEEAEAARAAAALGYVLRQGSVLLSDLDAAEGALYAVVRFDVPRVTPALAQAFYQHAARTHAGLGGGYSVVDDDMIFINLRDAGGKPSGGLADPDFLRQMQLAASAFPGTGAVAAGKARARLIANDWRRSPKGEDFLRLLGVAGAALAPLAARHDGLVRDAAQRHGWK